MSAAPKGSRRIVRIGALAVAWIWAVGWCVFGGMFAVGGVEGREATVGAIAQALVPGLVFVGLAILATRNAMWGGLSLVVVGSLVGALYPMLAPVEPLPAVLITEALMALPPLIAGALLILTAARVRRSPDAAPPVGDLP